MTRIRSSPPPMTEQFNPAADALFWCLPSIYGERYAVATCDGGSVLLDLESGAFYRLNAVAAAICRGLAREESVADIARGLTGTYHISLADATRDVEAVLEQMRQTRAPTGANPIR